MKLWLLKPREDVLEKDEDNPWDPWYDKTFGWVIRADTEEEARSIAQNQGGDEIEDRIEVYSDNQNSSIPPEGYILSYEAMSCKIYEKKVNAWLDEKYSTCTELTLDGSRGVVLKDFHST
ncbi:MAG: hypothetical protein HY376_02220 [Candidatus Blackburnbacteria bacterium]|nr:hypothetical protein [Candidatus Blackburnbacteria bacterium]